MIVPKNVLQFACGIYFQIVMAFPAWAKQFYFATTKAEQGVILNVVESPRDRKVGMITAALFLT